MPSISPYTRTRFSFMACHDLAPLTGVDLASTRAITLSGAYVVCAGGDASVSAAIRAICSLASTICSKSASDLTYNRRVRARIAANLLVKASLDLVAPAVQSPPSIAASRNRLIMSSGNRNMSSNPITSFMCDIIDSVATFIDMPVM